MMNLNLTSKPKIRVTGAADVVVDEISTIGELMLVAEKFGRLVEAEDGGIACRLATATGDLAHSLQHKNKSTFDFAEEVAGLMIVAGMIAARYGCSSEEVEDAIQRVMSSEATKAINASVQSMLNKRMSA